MAREGAQLEEAVKKAVGLAVVEEAAAALMGEVKPEEGAAVGKEGPQAEVEAEWAHRGWV